MRTYVQCNTLQAPEAQEVESVFLKARGLCMHDCAQDVFCTVVFFQHFLPSCDGFNGPRVKKNPYVTTSLSVQDLIQGLYIAAELCGSFALAVSKATNFSLPTL